MAAIEDDGFNDGLEDGGYEDVEEGDEPQAPVVAAPSVTIPKPKNKGGRPKKNHGVAGTAGVAAGPKPVDESIPETWPKDAPQLWAYLLKWAVSNGHEPSEIRGKVTRVSGGVVPGPATPLPQQIDCAAIVGDESVSPSEALENYLIDYYHLPMGAGPTRYRVEFYWFQSGIKIKGGEIALPASSEIMRLRQAAAMRAQSHQPQGYMPMGMGAASGGGGGGYQAAPQAQWPQIPQMPWGYPQQPDMGRAVDPLRAEVNDLRTKFATLIGKLEERNSHPTAPVAPTAPVTPPQPEASVEERVAGAVVAALLGAGVIGRNGNGVGVGAAPTPPAAMPTPHQPAPGGVDSLEKLFGDVMKLKRMMRMGENLFNDGPMPEATAEPYEPEPAKDPKDNLDWEVIPTGQKWPDGSDVIFTKPKEGKGWLTGLTGFCVHNPPFGEKVVTRVMDLAENTVKPIAEAIQHGFGGMSNAIGVGAPPQQAAAPNTTGEAQAEVVNNIPRDAKDAGGNGFGT